MTVAMAVAVAVDVAVDVDVDVAGCALMILASAIWLLPPNRPQPPAKQGRNPHQRRPKAP
jgi:hypothetical protein